MCAPGAASWPGAASSAVFCSHSKKWSVRAGFLSVCVSTKFQSVRFTFFPVAQEYFRARLCLFLREVRAGRFFVERVMDGMKRAIRVQDHHVFFRLQITEIADGPESGGNLVAINAIGSSDADGAPQVFIRVLIERR